MSCVAVLRVAARSSGPASMQVRRSMSAAKLAFLSGRPPSRLPRSSSRMPRWSSASPRRGPCDGPCEP
eukprot:9760417-Lingulodinium_polyedra.AAC.1